MPLNRNDSSCSSSNTAVRGHVRPHDLLRIELIPCLPNFQLELVEVRRHWMGLDLLVYFGPDEVIHDGQIWRVWRKVKGTAPVRIGLTEILWTIAVGKNPSCLQRPHPAIKLLAKVSDDLGGGVRPLSIMLLNQLAPFRVQLLEERDGILAQPIQVNHLVEILIQELQWQLETRSSDSTNDIHRGRVRGNGCVKVNGTPRAPDAPVKMVPLIHDPKYSERLFVLTDDPADIAIPPVLDALGHPNPDIPCPLWVCTFPGSFPLHIAMQPLASNQRVVAFPFSRSAVG